MATATITYKGVEFEVEYDYQPEEPMVMYYRDGSGYPGCPESAEITSITHQETDFSEILEDKYDEIEKLILESRDTEPYYD